jgi:hypothetical protein
MSTATASSRAVPGVGTTAVRAKSILSSERGRGATRRECGADARVSTRRVLPRDDIPRRLGVDRSIARRAGDDAPRGAAQSARPASPRGATRWFFFLLVVGPAK